MVRSQSTTDVAVPESVRTVVEGLARDEYAATMFVDDVKHVMISLEARTDVSPAEYQAAQASFEAQIYELLVASGLGLRYRGREAHDALGQMPWRIDSTIISTDVESVRLDKDRGADRALDWFASRGMTAQRWWSAGDSRSDYLMADAVHARGLPVAHLDVRPGDGMLNRPYDVVVEGDLVHDHAGGGLPASPGRRTILRRFSATPWAASVSAGGRPRRGSARPWA